MPQQRMIHVGCSVHPSALGHLMLFLQDCKAEDLSIKPQPREALQSARGSQLQKIASPALLEGPTKRRGKKVGLRYQLRKAKAGGAAKKKYKWAGAKHPTLQADILAFLSSKPEGVGVESLTKRFKKISLQILGTNLGVLAKRGMVTRTGEKPDYTYFAAKQIGADNGAQ